MHDVTPRIKQFHACINITVYGNARDLSDEEWIKVFQQLDANSDEHLDPQEIDLLSSDETLLFIVKQAGIVRSKDSDKEEL